MILSVVPDIWTHGLKTPSFRNGDGFDPNNYRAICVNSNLRKAFCTIIHSRLKHSHQANGICAKSQDIVSEGCLAQLLTNLKQNKSQ